MAGGLIKKYKWHLVVLVVLYAAFSVWLFVATDVPQGGHFDYEIN